MDKKSKILFWIMGILIVASVGATYWRIMIKKDYLIEAQTDCDPYAEKCFIWECDPESTEEGEACTGDPETDTWYFQVVRRNAKNIPLCDPNTDEECEALVCGENEPECEYIFCNEENMEEQYASACNDPEQYAIDNPEEADVCDVENEEGCEEAVEGDEGEEGDAAEDEECDPETEDCVDVNLDDAKPLPCDAGSDVCAL